MPKDTFTYALPNNKQSRAGARTCLCAIRQVTNLEKNPKEDSCKELFRLRDAAGQIMLDATGEKLSPFMAGFVLFLTEYIEDVLMRGEPPDLFRLNKGNGWNPETIRTKKQIEAMRKEHVDNYNELMAEENNVISLCAFRNK